MEADAEEGSDDEASQENSDDGEIHLHNPAVRRSPGGVWAEEILPVMEWEAPEHRIVLPPSLVKRTQLPTPVLRIAKSKRDKMAISRANDLPIIDRTGEDLVYWQFAGAEQGMEIGAVRWCVIYPDVVRVRIAVFGPDRNGSWSLISSHPLREIQFRRLIELSWMTRRDEE